MRSLRTLFALTLVIALAGMTAACDSATGQPAPTPTIVLVHGAWADGSTWRQMIPRLERAGYEVIAVQNPLSSYADDVATTKRVIDAQTGPVIVVGHSYGGAVMTGAATGSPNVKALVYVAAFAPDADEVFGQLIGRFGPSALDAALVPDKAGYLSIKRSSFHTVFAKDLSDEESRIMAATQKPINSAIFGASLPSPAWKSIPSWYLVSSQDQTIKPELQRFMAQRMGATTSEIKSDHVSYISHPDDVVNLVKKVVAVTVK